MNKKISHRVGLSIFAIAIILYVVPAISIASASTCVQLTANLASGQTDSTSNGPIVELQTFLHSLGILGASPSGYFGPATQSAVKKFQSDNGISVTGFVGPLTRTSIYEKTCTTSISGRITSSNISSDATVPAHQSVSTPTIGAVTSPATGQILYIGSSTVLRWSTSFPSAYNIIMEKPGGAGAGFIVMSQSPSNDNNQYVWRVGKVYSSQTNSYQNVDAGTYRIRLQNATPSTNNADEISGWFTIATSQFAANSIIPPSAFADDTTSVVLVGSGLTSSASIYFDTNYSNLRATNRYVSIDGTLLVFTIPTNIPVGLHTLFINDGKGSQSVTLPFTVSNIR